MSFSPASIRRTDSPTIGWSSISSTRIGRAATGVPSPCPFPEGEGDVGGGSEVVDKGVLSLVNRSTKAEKAAHSEKLPARAPTGAAGRPQPLGRTAGADYDIRLVGPAHERDRAPPPPAKAPGDLMTCQPELPTLA